MPRGAGLNGKVLVYNKNLTNTYNLTGDQVMKCKFEFISKINSSVKPRCHLFYYVRCVW